MYLILHRLKGDSIFKPFDSCVFTSVNEALEYLLARYNGLEEYQFIIVKAVEYF